MKRPTLTIGVRAGVPPLYALAGWEELDRYARLNHPLLAAVRERCLAAGLSECDSLKMLCAALLEESENQRAMIARYVAEVGTLPPPPLTTDSAPCPECYGGHFKPCQVCGDTGWVEIVPGQIHACDCKRMPTSRQPNTKLTGAERPV